MPFQAGKRRSKRKDAEQRDSWSKSSDRKNGQLNHPEHKRRFESRRGGS